MDRLDMGSIIVFLVVAFSFALILIWKKDSIEPRTRRFFATSALVMVVAAFVMFIAALYSN